MAAVENEISKPPSYAEAVEMYNVLKMREIASAKLAEATLSPAEMTKRRRPLCAMPAEVVKLYGVSARDGKPVAARKYLSSGEICLARVEWR